MQLEFKQLQDGLFVAGPTLSELAALPHFAGAACRLLNYDDIEPLEKKAKQAGLKISWSGDSPLELPRANLLKLFGEDKWARLEMDFIGADSAAIRLDGWENRYWKITGIPDVEALIVAVMQSPGGLSASRAAEISGAATDWLESGCLLRIEPDGRLKLAAMLRARSRLYLGLDRAPPGPVAMRLCLPGQPPEPSRMVSPFAVLPPAAVLYDRFACGAALLLVLAALLFAGLATLSWKMGWTAAGWLLAALFLLAALAGLRLAGARED